MTTPMPDEQVGLSPASIEQPEESQSTESTPIHLVENTPVAPEQESVVGEKTGKYEKLLSTVAQAAPVIANDEEEKGDVAHIQTLEGEAAKVEQLVKLAQTKGLAYSVKVAERMKDYYALDKFHDELVDNLYDALLQQGLITQE